MNKYPIYKVWNGDSSRVGLMTCKFTSGNSGFRIYSEKDETVIDKEEAFNLVNYEQGDYWRGPYTCGLGNDSRGGIQFAVRTRTGAWEYVIRSIKKFDEAKKAAHELSRKILKDET